MFRVKRSYRYMSAAFLALFIPLWGVCLAVFVLAVAKGNSALVLLAASIVLLGIPGLFVALGAYSLAACLREQLSLGPEGIEARGVFSTKSMSWVEVVEARWRERDALTLCAPDKRVKINFDAYAANDARDMIAIFRRSLPKRIQRGWGRFWIGVWRLFDVSETPEIAAADKARLRHRLDFIFLIGTVLAVAVSVAAVFVVGRWELFTVPAVLAGLWLGLRDCHTPPGPIAKSLGLPAEANKLILVGFLVFVLLLPLRFAFDLLELFIPKWIANLVMIAALIVVCVGVSRWQARRWPHVKRGAVLAQKQYFGAGPPGDQTGEAPGFPLS